jgi:hypothetical protein
VLGGSVAGAGQVMLGGLATLVSGFARRLAHFSWSAATFLTVSAALADDMMLSIAKAVNREDKLSRRYRDRDLAKFESSRRYRQR